MKLQLRVGFSNPSSQHFSFFPRRFQRLRLHNLISRKLLRNCSETAPVSFPRNWVQQPKFATFLFFPVTFRRLRLHNPVSRKLLRNCSETARVLFDNVECWRVARNQNRHIFFGIFWSGLLTTPPCTNCVRYFNLSKKRPCRLACIE